jgi:hypothetical protein
LGMWFGSVGVEKGGFHWSKALGQRVVHNLESMYSTQLIQFTLGREFKAQLHVVPLKPDKPDHTVHTSCLVRQE